MVNRMASISDLFSARLRIMSTDHLGIRRLTWLRFAFGPALLFSAMPARKTAAHGRWSSHHPARPSQGHSAVLLAS